jgi:Spy/CpxP family protein refolding chaperone
MLRMKALLAAGSLTVALAGVGAWGQGWGGGDHEAFGFFRLLAFHHAMKELDLTAPQRAQVKGILRSHRQEFQDITERLRSVHEAVKEVAEQDRPDEAAIRERVAAALDPLGDLAVLHARVHHDIHAVLTPEQRQKAGALHEKLREHFEEMRKSMHELGDDWLEDPS